MEPEIIQTVFSAPGQVLERFVNRTGLKWGIIAPEEFWHRSPAFHVFEATVLAPVTMLIFLKLFLPWVAGQHRVHRVSPKPPVFSDMVLGSLLAMCWTSQVIFKAMRPNAIVQLAWLLMPCHVATAAWACVLLQRPGAFNMTECRIAATFLTLSGWGAFLGMATPDWSDHRYRIEGVVFYVHHVLLAYTPFHWAFVHGSAKLSLQLALGYFFPCMFGNFYIYTPLAYMSGLNVNYNIYPPKVLKVVADRFDAPWIDTYYRFFITVFLIVSGCFVYGVVVLAETAWRRFNNAYRQMCAQREQAALQQQQQQQSSSSKGGGRNQKNGGGSRQRQTQQQNRPAGSAAPGDDALPVGKDGYVNPGGFVSVKDFKIPDDHHAFAKEQKPVPVGKTVQKKKKNA